MKHWSQEIQPIDPTQIRLVPAELAFALAKTALGDGGNTLGSQFPIDSAGITLQKIKGADGKSAAWYLIPLDFKSYSVWTSTDYVPSYVKVSAVDPYAKPILISGKKMRFTRGAFFSDNLDRILYEKYYDKVLMDYSFEEDDHGHAYWVITVCHPSIAYSGLVVDGVIIFDPETGSDEYVSQLDLEKLPQYAWVDRVMPAELVQEYINYWGNLKDGWWNSVWQHLNLLEAETPTINYASGDRCVFVTPVTSNNESDHTMTGLMYTDARTGRSTYYTTSGGATEDAIIKVVDAAVSFKAWHGSEQIVYENIYGRLSALVPVLGRNGNYEGLALVENDNKRLAVGGTPQEALMEFQKILMSSGGQITTENARNVSSFSGRIDRLGEDVNSNGKQRYAYFHNLRQSFLLNSEVQSEVALTQEGDEVEIRYIESDQAVVPTMYFRNKTLALQTSGNERSVARQSTVRREAVQAQSDVKDFKGKINEMSEEEIRQLMENSKKK